MITKLSQLAPRNGERAVLLGQTGCGKTWFARAMLGAYVGRRQVVILDSKHDPSLSRLKGARYCATLGDVQRAKFPRCPIVVWRPQGIDANDYDQFDAFYQWLYARGNTIAYIDEVAQTVQGPTSFGVGFNDVVCRGRVKGLVVLYGTQRPVLLPRIIFSESSRFYVFYITDRRDRQTIAAFTNPALEAEVPDRHGFYYYNVKTREVHYYSGLDLK
jgi:energy-coupling factor transporter ATP-binding protein EcfA2